MAQEFSKKFYKSKEWRIFRETLILERARKSDGFKCEECGKKFKESKDITLHHIIELTPDNIADTNISLNPKNIQVICHDCHNKTHKRFGYGRKLKKKNNAVYIIYGPPMAGKHSYVLENKQENDIVVDMDRLYEAITLLPRYKKPDALKYNVFDLRNILVDNIKTRKGNWNNAWIVGGYADKWQREKLLSDLGAELIFIEATKDDCYYRLDYCNDYRQYHKDEWKRYIDKWFEEHTK